MDTDTIMTSESLTLIEESVAQFAEAYIQPHVMEWDESQHFPKDLMHQIGEHGYLGVFVPEEYGGSGLGYQEYVASVAFSPQRATAVFARA